LIGNAFDLRGGFAGCDLSRCLPVYRHLILKINPGRMENLSAPENRF